MLRTICILSCFAVFCNGFPERANKNNCCTSSEEYSYCVQSTGRPQRCEQKGQFVPIPPMVPGSCIKGCVCQKGFLRNDLGNCVLEDLCPIPTLECGAYEETRCIQDCPPEKTCENRDINIACIQWYRGCENKCVCIDGYVRSDTGVCIPIDQCPPSSSRDKRAVCGENERISCEFPSCPSEKTCQTKDEELYCPDVVEDCQDRCVCKEHYFRNSGGICVTRAQCEICDGAHEYYSCGSECDNECSTIQVQNKTNCPIVNIVCNKKCYCEDGFARNHRRICIPIEQCLK